MESRRRYKEGEEDKKGVEGGKSKEKVKRRG